MPYGLKDKEFNKIQNEIVRKLYEMPSLDRAPFLVGCTEQELEEIEDFERQLQKATKHIKATVYAFGCGKCGAVCMTTKTPFDDWHECPTCRQMINLRDVSSHTIEIAEDTAEAWQEMLKESLEEAGR